MVDVTILPDPAFITPTISNVTPTEITPGQTFIIRGTNLVKRPMESPRVTFIFDNRTTVRVDPEDYSSEFIQAKMPDGIGGLQRSVCRLEVVNDLEQRAEQTVTFVPAEEILTIRTPGRLMASCNPWIPPFLCLIGDANRATVHDIRLINGWTVDDCVIDAQVRGANAGAYYVEKPEHGATRARAVIEAWADAYSRVIATETLFIKGPRGVAYR